MSKFCENCGAELKETDNVCPNCGTKVAEATKDVKTESANTATTKMPMDKKKMAMIGGIAAGVLVILIVILSLVLGGGSYKKPLDNMFKGIEKANSSKFLKAFPNVIVKDKDLKDTYDKDAMKEAKESLEDKYGKNVKITYKIKDKEKIDKDDIKDFNEDFQDEYGKKSSTKVSAGYKLTVNIKIKGKDDHKTIEDATIYVYKIGGKWCMVNMPYALAQFM